MIKPFNIQSYVEDGYELVVTPDNYVKEGDKIKVHWEQTRQELSAARLWDTEEADGVMCVAKVHPPDCSASAACSGISCIVLPQHQLLLMVAVCLCIIKCLLLLIHRHHHRVPVSGSLRQPH